MNKMKSLNKMKSTNKMKSMTPMKKTMTMKTIAPKDVLHVTVKDMKSLVSKSGIKMFKK